MYNVLRQFFVSTLISLIAIMCWQTVLAQPITTRAVTVIVPFAAGGGADGTIRLMQNSLIQKINQPVVIQNIIGAAGTIGTHKIANSPADGLIFGLSTGSTIGTGQLFSDDLSYNYANDFEYVAILGEVVRAVVVSSASPYKNFSEFLIDARKANLNIGVPGNSPDLLSAIALQVDNKLQYQVVQYGTNQHAMILDLLAGRTSAVFNSLAAFSSCLQAKTCKPLALTTQTRIPTYASIPTLQEMGYGSASTVASYYGMIAPKGTSLAMLTKMNNAVNETLADVVINKQLLDFGIITTPHTLNESKQLHFDHVKNSLGKKKYLSAVNQ